jgi:hypothetical protein
MKQQIASNFLFSARTETGGKTCSPRTTRKTTAIKIAKKRVNTLEVRDEKRSKRRLPQVRNQSSDKSIGKTREPSPSREPGLSPPSVGCTQK